MNVTIKEHRKEPLKMTEIPEKPLISKNTLIQLGMLQIKEDGSFGSQNDMCIPGNNCMVETLGTARQAIEAKF